MRHQGPWRHRFTLITALLWAMIPGAIAVALAPSIQDQQLRGVVYTGAGGLFFGGFLGGMLKVLLDEVVAYKRQREDAAQFVANVLADLKSVHDRVGRAQLLIPAHQSVKTYGNEMRDLIEAGVQLRNVVRAFEPPPRRARPGRPHQDRCSGTPDGVVPESAQPGIPGQLSMAGR